MPVGKRGERREETGDPTQKMKKKSGEWGVDEAIISHCPHGKLSPYPANKSQAVLQ